MKILKVFGLIIFLISLMISLVMINILIHGMELVLWEKPISIIAFILTICLGYLFRKTLLKILLIPFQVFKRDMNQKQRLVLAIFVPIIILFIALIIANSITYVPTYGGGTKKYRTSSKLVEIYPHGPFNLDKTWYVWFSALAFCGIFEYKLFADKKKKDKELTGI